MSYHLNNFLKSQILDNDVSYLYLLSLIKMQKEKKLTKEIFSELGNIDKIKRRVKRNVEKYRQIVDQNMALARNGSNLVLSPLKSIQVKNFRGFSSLNDNDEGTLIPFSKGVNVFFAPNGGGKTSLCEAIEYSLTNNVKEASRRNTPLKSYIKNGGSPSIICKLVNGTVSQSPFWNSCFIDRNRLQEFSLLGSKDTNVRQADVLATLFELEEIDGIINGMVKPASFKAVEFVRTSGQDSYEAVTQQLADKRRLRKTKIDEIQQKQQLLAELFGLEKYEHAHIVIRKNYFDRLKKHLMLSTQKFDVASEEVRLDSLAKYIDSITWLIDLLASKRKVLATYASKVNYKDLYQAIKNFGDMSEIENCPTCETPIKDVRKHPQKVVEDELPKLEFLEQVSITSEKIEHQLKERIAVSFAYIQACLKLHRHTLTEGLVSTINNILSSDTSIPVEYLKQLSALYGFSTEIEKLNDDIRARNKRVANQTKRLESLNAKIDHIEKKLKSATVFETNIEAKSEILLETHKEIVRLLKQSKTHSSQILLDEEFNDFAKPLEDSYKKLFSKLNEYKRGVESENINGIELSTLSYYNQINKHDNPNELVSEVKFQQKGGTYRIILKMRDGREDDAFCVLSEGHLRGLGLALLLSVAKKNCHPVIVFDDVVNAIDTEHRSNIIDMFSDDVYLKKVQRIITTHDRMFWEKISNRHKRATDADTFSSQILKSTSKGIVIQNFGVNYSQKVKEALEVYDIRQALVYSRIWFETMINEYCVRNEIKITTIFSSRQLKKDNWLEISLEATYSEFAKSLNGNVDTFNYLKNDLINWGGQNQEHHAFDEYNYNFSHATTSLEVQTIYEKLWVLEAQLNQEKTIEKLNNEKAEHERIREQTSRQLASQGFVDNADQELVQNCRDRLEQANRELRLLNKILEQV
ncbi:AAA family ATPase [Shewanella psychromarinicola]|uniref:Recombination protein RecF n=1 Tax=Shewanella psychromarinicola TaxID=2487742 RepID=A0A3N4E9B2_9GAMM|nr:AAA family ATPase [Shewanella psychromarinicola]AZG34818.1 recombination protein RecF [Shewanella psychromarinicola]MCL1082964.1 AAA family ATPase [Shewanella psychromarinicola]RPA33392.1 recombination protein RecF [Shewanella psychromarinicola]